METELTEEVQDGRKARGDRTKRAILDKAVDVASVEGLEGLSIGRLAAELGVSKSGLFAHFGSKLELQLETVDAASELFEEQVWQPVAELEPGVVQLGALMESWLRYFRDPGTSGGCFFSNAYHEFDARPGPVRDAIAAQKGRWMAAIVHHVNVGDQARPAQGRHRSRAARLRARRRWLAGQLPVAARERREGLRPRPDGDPHPAARRRHGVRAARAFGAGLT